MRAGSQAPAENIRCLRSFLLGGVRIDAHQLPDAEGGLQKRDRLAASRCACGCSAGICGRRPSSRRDSTAASSAGDELCRVILRPLAISSGNGIRPQAVFSLPDSPENVERGMPRSSLENSLAFLLRFHPVPQCNVFLYLLFQSHLLNKRMRALSAAGKCQHRQNVSFSAVTWNEYGLIAEIFFGWGVQK